MLYTREAEIRIILVHLEKKKEKLLNTLDKLKLWSSQANVNLNEYPLYLTTKADLEIVNWKIDGYKEL
jgi:hypothetical protein